MDLEKRSALLDKAKKQLTDKSALTALKKDGKLTAYELMNTLFDEGTFVETNAYVKNLADEFGKEAGTAYESVVCGYGAVDGRLVFAYAQDLSRENGAFSAAAANKITSLYKLALKNGAPVVSMFDSVGAKVLDGVSVLSAYGKIMKLIASVKGKVPQISVVLGKACGAPAVISSMADLMIVSEGASVSVNPANVLIDAGADKDIASAKSVFENGVCADITANAAEALNDVRSILTYLPSNRLDRNIYGGIEDEAGRATPEIADIAANDNYDVHAVIASLADGGAYKEVFAGRGKAIVTALAFIGGISVGIVANNPSVKGGKLCKGCMNKTAQFISLCDSFGISLVNLVGTSGFAAECEAKGKALSKPAAKMAFAYATAKVPVVTLNIGEAYGTAFTLMGSKSLGADMVFALDTAKIGVLAPASGVAMLWSDKLAGAKNPTEKRKSLEEDYALYESTPLLAASVGDVDDIIPAAEARARIASALEMLSMKSDFAAL